MHRLVGLKMVPIQARDFHGIYPISKLPKGPLKDLMRPHFFIQKHL